jgi:hypothetical protein
MRRFEIDELLVRPGTYFNPQTEVLLIVDDTPEIDQATFDADPATDDADWVHVSDEVPVDEASRDELLQSFQATYHEGVSVTALDDEPDTGEDDEDEDELEPDELQPDDSL